MSKDQQDTVVGETPPAEPAPGLMDSSSAGMDVRTMTHVAAAVALSAALSFLPLFTMPQGGTVALDMVPIIFLAFYRGVKPGVLAGVIYGLVNLSLNPFIVHPAQVILDYPLAFGLVGLAGIAGAGGPVAIGLGAIVGGSLRFIAHFASGLIFFGSYAPKGQSVWAYSAIYNGSYMLVSVLLAIPLVFAMLKVMDSNGAQTAD